MNTATFNKAKTTKFAPAVCGCGQNLGPGPWAGPWATLWATPHPQKNKIK